MIQIILFALLLITAEASEKPPLMLGQGEQRILRLPQVKKYSIGAEIVRGTLLPQQHGALESLLLIKGVKPGQTDLWVWKTDGSSEHRSILVEKISTSELSSSLLKALTALEEAEVIYTGSGVVLRGEISSIAETIKIQAVVNANTKTVQDQTTLTVPLLEQGRTALLESFEKSVLLDSLSINIVGQDLVVQGTLQSTHEQAAALKIIDSVFPRAKTELLALPDNAPTVHFKVFLLELKKSRFGTLGLDWPALQEGAFQVTPFGVANKLRLDLMLQALEGNGSLRILSKPELVVRAPGEAELFAGGEIPLTARNRFGSNVTWKNYGLTLRLKVTHSTRDRVRVDVLTEVSHLDASTALNEIPGIQANRMKTQIDARYGSPLFLSGLLQQGTRETARGLPLLRNLPILGALFGSEDYLNERSELVAILLPNLTPPPAALSRFENTQYPLGPVPLPRNMLTLSEIKILQQSPEYPWNALK